MSEPTDSVIVDADNIWKIYQKGSVKVETLKGVSLEEVPRQPSQQPSSRGKVRQLSSNRPSPLMMSLTILVAIIALGELFALFLNYQNNFYQRQYVSENTPLIFEQIIGLTLLGPGSGFIAYKLSNANRTERLG